MEDLQYIVAIGFSGADMPRAIILSFLFAMFAKKESNIWRMAFLALLIDRTVWPIAEMGASGAGFQSIIASFIALFKTFFNDLGIYIVRYIGLVLMVTAFVWLRAGIHKILPNKRGAGRTKTA